MQSGLFFLIALVLRPVVAFVPPTAACRRCAISMSAGDDAEAAARKAWMERQSNNNADRQQPQEPSVTPEDEMRMRQEARKRMLAAMGGESGQLKNGMGAAFGFGAADDENYGYSPQSLSAMSDDDREEREMDLAGWLTNDPVGAKEFQEKRSSGGGFGGRLEGWKRKKDATDPNPPRMANTLRAPGENSVSVQTYLYDHHAQGQVETRAAANADADAEEAALLESLLGSIDSDADAAA